MDAWGRLMLADEFLKRYDYAGAIREAQVALELASKALLDKLSIDYYSIKREGRKRFVHDVSDKIPEAFEKLKPYLKEDLEVDQAQVSLAMIAVLVKLLTSVKSYGEFGIKVGERKVEAREVFGPNFADMVEALVGLMHVSLSSIEDLMQKLSRAGV